MPKRQNKKKSKKNNKSRSRKQSGSSSSHSSQPPLTLEQINFDFIEKCNDRRTMKKVVDMLENEPFEALRNAAIGKLRILTPNPDSSQALEDTTETNVQDTLKALADLERMRDTFLKSKPPDATIPPVRNQSHSNGSGKPKPRRDPPPPSSSSVEEIQERVALSSKAKGNECFKAGDYSEAIQHYTKGIKHYQKHAPLFANRAACHLKQGDFKNASKDCSKALALDPNYVKAYCRRGEANMGMKKWEFARQDFESGLELDGENTLMRKHLATVMKKLSKKKKKGFQVPIETVTSESDMKATENGSEPRTKIPVEEGSFSESDDEGDDEKAPPSEPPPPSQPRQPGKTYPKADQWKTEGNAHFKSGQYDQAIAVYQKAIDSMMDLKPESHTPEEWYKLTCSALNNQALSASQSDNFDFVIRATTQSIRLLEETVITSNLRPVYWKALFRRAQAYDKAGNISAALQDMQCAYNTLPNADTQTALVRMRKEFAEDAAAEANDAKDRGNAFYKKKQFEQAIEVYSRGIEKVQAAEAKISLRGSLKTTMTNLMSNRGLMYSKLNRAQEAVDDFTYVLERIDADNVKALHRRATVYETLDRLEEAREDWARLMNMEDARAEYKANYDRLSEILASRPRDESKTAVEDVTEENEIPLRYRRAGESYIEFEKAWSRVKNNPQDMFTLCETNVRNLPRLLKKHMGHELLGSILMAIQSCGLTSQQTAETGLDILEAISQCERLELSVRMLENQSERLAVFDQLGELSGSQERVVELKSRFHE